MAHHASTSYPPDEKIEEALALTSDNDDSCSCENWQCGTCADLEFCVTGLGCRCVFCDRRIRSEEGDESVGRENGENAEDLDDDYPREDEGLGGYTPRPRSDDDEGSEEEDIQKDYLDDADERKEAELEREREEYVSPPKVRESEACEEGVEKDTRDGRFE